MSDIILPFSITSRAKIQVTVYHDFYYSIQDAESNKMNTVRWYCRINSILSAFYCYFTYKVLISFSGVTNHIHYEPRQVVTIIIITRQPERRTFFWYPMCLLKTTLKMLLSVSSLLDWWSFWRSTGFCTFCLVIFYSCLNCILGKHAAVKFNWRKGEMFCDFPAKKKKWQISSKKKR